jgi:hypothetical protein
MLDKSAASDKLIVLKNELRCHIPMVILNLFAFGALIDFSFQAAVTTPQICGVQFMTVYNHRRQSM